MNQHRLSFDELDPAEWDDDEVLRELYVERGWSADDIVAWAETDLQPSGMSTLLYRRGIRREQTERRPRKGLAGKLWDIGMEEKMEGES